MNNKLLLNFINISLGFVLVLSSPLNSFANDNINMQKKITETQVEAGEKAMPKEQAINDEQTALKEKLKTVKQIKEYKEGIIGLWEVIPENNHTESIFYYFDKNMNFAVLNQNSSTGISWNILPNNNLELVTVPMPKDEPHEELYKIIDMGLGKITLNNSAGSLITLKRSTKEIAKISGKLAYRERIALPPIIELNVKLFADGIPLASSSLPKRGNQGLDFTLYFLEQAENINLDLEASINYNFNTLFSTRENVVINKSHYSESADAEREPLFIMLTMDNSHSNAKTIISVPSAYQSQDKNYILYLEGNNFGVLKIKDKSEPVLWNQVDRNHNLEILRLGKDPIFITISNEDELVVGHIDGQTAVSLYETFDILTEENLNLIAKYEEENQIGILTDCTSKMRFDLDISQIPQLHQAFQNADQQAGIANLNANISRNDNDIKLKVNSLESFSSEQICPKLANTVSLRGSYWRLLSINGVPAQTYENQAEPHLIIRDNQANGSDGCNLYFMAVDTKENMIKFEHGGSTLKMCPFGDEQARNMLQNLNKVNSYDINGSILELKMDSDVLLRFEVVYF